MRRWGPNKVRVDLEVMRIRVYSILPRFSELESHPLMQFSAEPRAPYFSAGSTVSVFLIEVTWQRGTLLQGALSENRIH